MSNVAAVIPVAFANLNRLMATVTRYCGQQSSMLTVRKAHRSLGAGDTIRLALLTPEIRFPIDINATVVARTFKPTLQLKVEYRVADLSQVECALGQLYSRSPYPQLPMALKVVTGHHRQCQMSALSGDGATFDVAGPIPAQSLAPDAKVQLQLPHSSGRVDLAGEVSWFSSHLDCSRLHVNFTHVGSWAKQKVDDIVLHFALGQAPWTPRLEGPGL